MIYFFDDYELDTARYELRHSSAPVHIEPKVFDVLIYLIEHQGQVVTKEDLHTHLWADQFVSDSALTYCIASARKAVGDTGRNQRIIKTVHRRGYSFIAQVRSQSERLEEAPEASDASTATASLSSHASEAHVPETIVSPPDLPVVSSSPAQEMATDSPAPLVPERRQLTVMWCRMAVASESALQFDPEEQHEVTLQAQTLFGEVIRRFDGYLAQRAGHGLLVYFGYPQAHEDDAHRAMRVGLAVV